jgi:hypothetical protein
MGNYPQHNKHDSLAIFYGHRQHKGASQESWATCMMNNKEQNISKYPKVPMGCAPIDCKNASTCLNHKMQGAIPNHWNR